MTRAELIKALESLEGPSREVADHVLLACGWKRDGRLWKSPQIKYYQEHERPNPLASIDSALTLAPYGCNAHGYDFNPKGGVTAYLSRNYVKNGHWVVEGWHKTLVPVAFCIAALKAQESPQ